LKKSDAIEVNRLQGYLQDGNGVVGQKVERVLKIPDPKMLASEMHVGLSGTMPLIVHCFSEKARNEIEACQTGKKTTSRKVARKPEVEFLDALHVVGPRPKSLADLEKKNRKSILVFPAGAVRAAMVTAASISDDTYKSEARAAFRVVGHHGNMLEIDSDSPPVMRSDYVRQRGTPTIRYRPMFEQWGLRFTIRFFPQIVSAERLFGWLVNAGQMVGLGDWRMLGRESAGEFGSFEVTFAKVIEFVRKDQTNGK
jgi:hypothetical protein